jgi:hypothetical protein
VSLTAGEADRQCIAERADNGVDFGRQPAARPPGRFPAAFFWARRRYADARAQSLRRSWHIRGPDRPLADDHAGVRSAVRKILSETIAARAGFVAEAETLNTWLAQTLDKPAQLFGPVQKTAEMTHLPALRPIGNRDRNRRPVDIHPHEDGIAHQIRPQCLRLSVRPIRRNPRIRHAVGRTASRCTRRAYGLGEGREREPELIGAQGRRRSAIGEQVVLASLIPFPVSPPSAVTAAGEACTDA